MRWLFVCTVAALMGNLAWAETPAEAETVPFGSVCPYPSEALAKGESGQTVFTAQVDAENRLANVKLYSSSGHGALDAAALACVKRWRDAPEPPPSEKALSITISWVLPIEKGHIPGGYYSVGKSHSCPPYPQAAEKTGTEGGVRLAFRIETDGRAHDFVVDRSSGSEILDEAAVQCASRWRYKPARDDRNQPIAMSWKAQIFWIDNTIPNVYFAEPAQTCVQGLVPSATELGAVDSDTHLAFGLQDGKAKDIRIFFSSGSAKLDAAAAACVAGWTLRVPANYPSGASVRGRMVIHWKDGINPLETIVRRMR